jgi:hypothetical protein
MMNAYYGDLDFRIPDLPTPLSWQPLVDTAEPTGRIDNGRLYAPGESYRLQAHSFALFINRAPRPEPPPAPTAAEGDGAERPEASGQFGFGFQPEDGGAGGDDVLPP